MVDSVFSFFLKSRHTHTTMAVFSRRWTMRFENMTRHSWLKLRTISGVHVDSDSFSQTFFFNIQLLWILFNYENIFRSKVLKLITKFSPWKCLLFQLRRANLQPGRRLLGLPCLQWGLDLPVVKKHAPKKSTPSRPEQCLPHIIACDTTILVSSLEFTDQPLSHQTCKKLHSTRKMAQALLRMAITSYPFSALALHSRSSIRSTVTLDGTKIHVNINVPSEKP